MNGGGKPTRSILRMRTSISQIPQQNTAVAAVSPSTICGTAVKDKPTDFKRIQHNVGCPRQSSPFFVCSAGVGKGGGLEGAAEACLSLGIPFIVVVRPHTLVAKGAVKV